MIKRSDGGKINVLTEERKIMEIIHVKKSIDDEDNNLIIYV